MNLLFDQRIRPARGTTAQVVAHSVGRLSRHTPIGPDEAILGVDSNVDGIFDMEDATKVLLEGDRVVGSGASYVTDEQDIRGSY